VVETEIIMFFYKSVLSFFFFHIGFNDPLSFHLSLSQLRGKRRETTMKKGRQYKNSRSKRYSRKATITIPNNVKRKKPYIANH
jgi:hypothetical protein